MAKSPLRKLFHGGFVQAAIAVAIGLAVWIGATPSVNAATITFKATIEGAQEVPPTATGAMASGTFVMDDVANTLSYTINVTVPPPSGEIFSHIHGFSAPGFNSGILHNLPNGSPKVGVWNFLEAQEANIKLELTYANIHSNDFGGGEIRGQILNACGDGIVDLGEVCDDPVCCDVTCQTPAADGTSCTAGAFPGSCQAGVCNGPDHYACYQAKDLKVPAKFSHPDPIVYSNAVDNGNATKCKPKFLCVPTVKDGSPVSNPDLNYMCYQCKGTKPVVAYDITDQFGEIQVQTKKLKLICNPATRNTP